MCIIRDEGLGNDVDKADDLQEALRKAREYVRTPELCQAGDPVTIWQNGKVVWKLVMGPDGKVKEQPGG